MSKTIAEHNYPVSQTLPVILAKRGLKQKYVAEKAGYKDSSVITEMINNRRIIKPIDIIKLSAAIGIEPNDLFDPDPPERIA